MFQIREEQMNAFSADQVNRFVVRMVSLLKTEFPNELAEQKLEDSDLEPLVRRGIEIAKHFEIYIEADVELFIECLVIFSPQFYQDERHAWAHEILSNKERTGTQKMDEVHDHLVFSTSKARQS